MADSNKTATGSSDDLNVDASRCLRMRYSESSCRHCTDICPHGAVILDGCLTINPDQCQGCMLCTSVCPVGALEQNGDFNACLAKLSKVPEPILGCIRTRECSNGTVTCLGGLSEEHLLVLCLTLSGKLTINLTACKDCPNSAIISHLRQRLEVLSESGLLKGDCCIVTAESAQDIIYHDESLDRRSFFKSFRSSLFQSAAIMLSVNNKPTERRAEYAAKRLPIRRELINSVRNKPTRELLGQMQKHFDVCVTFSEACTMCQGCVAICPTGALKTEVEDGTPFFEQLLCSGCGLCSEFCLDGAVRFY